MMTEFGFVRELNEGVKKIFADMEDAGLLPPEYRDTPNSVILTLRNNVDKRTAHRNKTVDSGQNLVLNESDDIWDQMDEEERKILLILKENGALSRANIAKILCKPDRTVSRKLGHLVEMGIVINKGNKHDKNNAYSLKPN